MNDARDHDETLTVSFPVWCVALLVGGSIAWALGFFFSDLASLITLGVGVTLIVLGLWRLGAVRITTSSGGLRAGNQRIDWTFVGEPEALDAAATRLVLGRDANTAASLITRPYIATSVRVPIEDESDPHPYWLISTRHPAHLVSAINRHREGSA